MTSSSETGVREGARVADLRRSRAAAPLAAPRSRLLEEARNYGAKTDRGTKIKLRLTHNQLAARIGTVREVVTRMLVRLQEQGLIVHDGKDILIPDMQIISAYAGDRFGDA